MTRAELLKIAKPCLFNTEMTRAILDDIKTATRRLVKHNVEGILNSPYHKEHPEVPDKQLVEKLCLPRYQVGDILYVRETWHKYTKRVGKGEGCYLAEFYGYKASIANSEDANEPWKPSIHMPKEAARIFLKVTDVRPERLQDITEEQALMEGVPSDTDYPINKVYCPRCHGNGLIGAVHEGSLGYIEVDCTECDTAIKRFKNLWDSTVDKKELDRYGWEANPWVWVYAFERIEPDSEV